MSLGAETIACFAYLFTGSVFILDVLMALRFGRATLIQQDLVDNPLPSVTGSEEVELWRPGTDLGHIRDKALRATSSSQNPPQQLAHSATSRVVRSHALSAFNELIKLCGVAALIATRLNRTTQGCPDDTPSMNDILSRLQMWEAALPSQLRPSRSPTEASVLSHEMMLMQKALCLLCLRPSTNDRQLSDTCISAFNNCLEDAESYCRSAAVARSRAGFDYFALAIVTTLTYPLPIHRQRYTKHHWHTCLQVLRQQSVLYPAAQTTLRCLEALPHFKVLTKENTNQQAHVPPAMSVTPKADPLFLHQLPPLPLPSNANAHSWLSLSSDQQWSGNNTGGIGQPNLNAHVLAQDGGLDFFGSGSDDVLSLLGLKGPTRPPSATIGLPSEETQTDRDLLYHFQHQGDVDMSNLSFLL